MENRMYVLDMWSDFRGHTGGTIHEALREFATLPLTEKDRFCGRLADATRDLLDPEHAVEFMRLRMEG